MKRASFRLSKRHALLYCALFAAHLPACVKLPQATSQIREETARAESEGSASGARRVPLNKASRAELERLPGVGPALAGRIVAHRERYGPFRRVEHLIIVPGISERRFRQMRDLVTLE